MTETSLCHVKHILLHQPEHHRDQGQQEPSQGESKTTETEPHRNTPTKRRKLERGVGEGRGGIEDLIEKWGGGQNSKKGTKKLEIRKNDVSKSSRKVFFYFFIFL